MSPSRIVRYSDDLHIQVKRFADAHRDDGKRFIVRSDQKLMAFLELERITHELAVSALLRDDTGRKGRWRVFEAPGVESPWSLLASSR